MSARQPRLSEKLRRLDTMQLESMASGLRSMKKGQKRLLKLLEEEIASRPDNRGSRLRSKETDR